MNLTKINFNIIDILLILKFFIEGSEKKITFVSNNSHFLWNNIT